MKDVEIIGMLKSYINKTLVGMGALKGAPCEVQGVVDGGDGTQTLTLEWEDTSGASHTTDIILPAAIFAIASPENGQTLRYNATSGKFENSNVSFSINLDDIDDVVINSVQNGQVLTYDAANHRWINSDGSTVANLSDLTDVVITTAQNGQVLSYNGTSGKWVNVALAAVATSGSYNDLTDQPDIPDAQVQSDWNEADSTKVDYIKNKPTLGTAAAKDSTNAVTQGSTDLLESGAAYTELAKKANTNDLGTAAAKDSTASVTENSTDLVESGGVFTAIDNARGDVTETQYSAIASILS